MRLFDWLCVLQQRERGQDFQWRQEGQLYQYFSQIHTLFLSLAPAVTKIQHISLDCILTMFSSFVTSLMKKRGCFVTECTPCMSVSLIPKDTCVRSLKRSDQSLESEFLTLSLVAR